MQLYDRLPGANISWVSRNDVALDLAGIMKCEPFGGNTRMLNREMHGNFE